MKNADIEDIATHKLVHREIKPTPVRLLILREIMKSDSAVSITELENRLESVDKSTIFRVMTLFHSHRLVHCVDDGSGSLKYALCRDDCNCSLEEEHIHFYCTICHKTFCFSSINIPKINLSGGFKVNEANFVLKGVCASCNNEFKQGV